MFEWPSRPNGEDLPRIARVSVERALHRDLARPALLAEGLLGERRGVFVTVWKRPDELRGCIGSLEPRCPTVWEETWRIAREAALSDRRFKPVTSLELTELIFEVSVLGSLELIQSESELDPDRFGVVVRTPDGRRGALLPALPDVRTVQEQLKVARLKGAISKDEPVHLERFTVQVFGED